ncbi:MAG: polysaccharide deacetylase family protein [Synergistaceae bacterium]|nr:polysaccharide deacetylase family protein [Synergistaceae bacterium]
MRKFLILILILISSSKAFSDDWQLDKYDLKRAFKNNFNPPAKLRPDLNLEPIEDLGVIRRVNLRDKNLKAVALTFDMCELDTNTSGCDMDTLKFLRDNNIKATLFMGGKWMRTHERRVKQIMLEHKLFEIANHNWSHGNCAIMPRDKLEDQILWTQAQFELTQASLNNNKNNLQQIPVLFRLPYGRNSESALKIIAGLGLKVIQWDVAIGEANNLDLKNARRNAQQVSRATRPGSILLFHANLVPKGTANLIKELIKILKSQGYEFVTVSELLQLGEPECVRIGYFNRPGDNVYLDKKFGTYGTGLKIKK